MYRGEAAACALQCRPLTVWLRASIGDFAAASELADYFCCQLNIMAMYLLVRARSIATLASTHSASHAAQRRKKRRDSGVYQATSFKFKFKADPNSK